MKRRLNIFCLLIMLVLGYSILEAGYYFYIGARTGVQAAASDPDNCPELIEKVAHMKYIHLAPSLSADLPGSLFLDSVYNAKGQSYVPATYGSLLASIDTHPGTGERVANALLNILQVILLVWAIALFVKLIIAINKSDIFNWRNVRRLRRLGMTLIGFFGCVFAAGYLDYRGINEVFALEGYSVVLSDSINITTLVLGLCSLIVGEVFAIGLRMKEEQDLTI